jgi:hypothetical protein
VFEDLLFGRGDDDFNDLVVTIEPIDESGSDLVFRGLTPELQDELANIVADPQAVESRPQVTPDDVPASGFLANASPPPVPTLEVDPDPGLAAA